MYLRRFLSLSLLCAGFLSAQPAFAATNNDAPAPKILAHVYESWVYRCAQVAVAGKPDQTSCQVFQRLGITNNGKTLPLAVIAFQKTEDNHGYLLNALVPLGILLPPGVSFSGDDMPPVVKNLTFCQPGSCVIMPQPADGLVAELQSAKEGHLRFVGLNDRTITVTFPLKGFNAAIKALDSGVPPSA